MEWKDGKCRCNWVNPKNEKYIKYHDEKWGKPVYDDKELFKMLILETFQAGLSWECILNKEDAFCDAFDNFDIEKIVNYSEKKLNELYNTNGIIKNKLKINSVVTNARIFKNIATEFGSFNNYIWDWTHKKIIYENDKTTSPLSDKISKDLKKRGMKFIGTTTIYSYLQAVGIIYSHQDNCFLKHI